MTNKMTTQPYKGSRDFYPEDMKIRNFIFDTWKKVCKSYGYEEYDGPFIESFELYAAKSGEELVNEQLYSFEDRGKRKVAIRPEMTPTLARMVASKINELPKPIRWFSIANFWRYEKPQRGRGREFFQLNLDMFGIEGVEADLEVISTSVDILKSFGAKETMFEVRFNNRRLADDIYRNLGLSTEQKKLVNKALDKKLKISQEEFNSWLKDDAKLSNLELKSLNDYLENPMPMVNQLVPKSKGAQEVVKLTELINNQGLSMFVKFDPTIIRGLDYYTGNVFEVYDLNPQNIRAIAGGGRYDDLVTVFGKDKLTGTGYAMGDITLKDFLKGWNLLPKFESECEYLITLWPSEDPKFLKKELEISKILRNNGLNVQTWLENNTKLEKQLKYADKKGCKYVIIIGENELKDNLVTIKNLKDSTQETKPLEKFISDIK
ncbi:histidine--tRNA ligase [candidate division WWE3 bacterium]|uniref:Histidine--tRNA ligase n=1 Tax=candidate division WWE3 bacterium TaxID=2053526 RepID=A0A7X9HTX6_UNCKA|nr:histidine--tRNA ligase [candidate division WWE3 bacterium]